MIRTLTVRYLSENSKSVLDFKFTTDHNGDTTRTLIVQDSSLKVQATNTNITIRSKQSTNALFLYTKLLFHYFILNYNSTYKFK